MEFLTTAQGERVLRRLQRVGPGNRMPCRLKNDAVMVSPQEGNLFQILSVPCDDPGRSGSYRYLESVGAQLGIQRENGSMWQYAATVTLDTMLHHLIIPRALTLT